MTNRIEKAEYPIQIITNPQKVVFPDEILHKNDPRLQDHTCDAIRYCTGPLQSKIDNIRRIMGAYPYDSKEYAEAMLNFHNK